MALPGLRTSITPHAIITSWRSSLSRQVPNKQHIGPLRAFFSSNSCLKQSSHKSNTFFGAKPSGSAKSRSPPRINSSCSTSSKTSPVSFFQQGIFANSSLFNSHKGWTTSGTARFFSVSTIIKAARPNWYAGRQMETVRAGPIKKLQWTIDRKIPKSWLFYGIIIANIVVFLGWQYAINSATRFRDFGPYTFMMKNFAASWANLLRPWTIITSCFSHMDTTHIFVNLFSFYFMGQAAMSILSTSQFTSLYLLAGLVGNAVQMLWHPVQGNTRQPSFALGASGAISGVLSFYAMAFPHHKLVLFFVIPAPAWLAVSGIIAYDMYTAVARPNGGIAAAAHLGGAGAGILYFLKLAGRRPF